MEHYEEERAANKYLKNIYQVLVDQELTDNEQSLANMYVMLMEKYGRGQLWCDKKLKKMKEAGQFDKKEKKADILGLNISDFGEAVDDKTSSE